MREEYMDRLNVMESASLIFRNDRLDCDRVRGSIQVSAPCEELNKLLMSDKDKEGGEGEADS